MSNITIARAPATVANLICGFDTLALAIDGLYDEVSVQPNDLGKWVIESIENGGNIPLDPAKNVCTAAMEVMRKKLGDDQGYTIHIKKGYQAGSGLGSSAASAVAALWAYNAQLNFPLTQREIIPYAMLSEELVSGKAIADNVAAAALGGVVLIRSDVDYDFVSLPVPELTIACLLPDIQIMTRQARSILPLEIPLADSVTQGANLAGFISSLYTSDWDVMRRSMQDVLIEKYRGPLIPFYFEAKKLALENGAICFGIGGSGPAVFYFCEYEQTAKHISKLISTMWNQQGMKSSATIGKINTTGVTQRFM
jgi:homoserine kinase